MPMIPIACKRVKFCINWLGFFVPRAIGERTVGRAQSFLDLLLQFWAIGSDYKGVRGINGHKRNNVR
jgi:hypothetical protein